MMRIIVLATFISCTSVQTVSDSREEAFIPSFSLSDQFALSAPQVEVDSMIFSKSATLAFLPPTKGAYVTYEVDQQPTRNSRKADGLVTLSKSGIIHARAYHPDYQESDVISLDLKKVKDAITINTITTSPLPNERYAAGGMKVLHDRKRGGLNFGNGDWLGFNEQVVALELSIDQSTLSKISIGILQNHGAWIFSPKSITVKVDDTQVGHINVDHTRESDEPRIEFYVVKLSESILTAECQVIIEALEGIPEWHPGKGTIPWTFIDEIIIE